MTDNSGAVQALYSYDPFGVVSTLQESTPSDFGYSGHYYHSRSNLNLPVYRAYSPSLGKWLSRDPLGERISQNLNAYVGNNPINLRDPLGLIDSVSASLSKAIATGNAAEIQLILNATEGTGALTAAQIAGANLILAKLPMTADKIISTYQKASVRGEFPRQLLCNTLKEIIDMAKTGDKVAQTAKKLLTDSRFAK